MKRILAVLLATIALLVSVGITPANAVIKNKNQSWADTNTDLIFTTNYYLQADGVGFNFSNIHLTINDNEGCGWGPVLHDCFRVDSVRLQNVQGETKWEVHGPNIPYMDCQGGELCSNTWDFNGTGGIVAVNTNTAYVRIEGHLWSRCTFTTAYCDHDVFLTITVTR